MGNLDIINIYDNSSKTRADDFLARSKSELSVKTDKNKIVRDIEWIDMMNSTIPYLDKIFRKPNRFIINEEEIVKIEQTKKVTVESIKHLSKNTNFIQTIDKQTGDVTPSKLLNVRKEETFSTYENRFAYTLIQNMKLFLKRRKDVIEGKQKSNEKNGVKKNKNNKNLEYKATTEIRNEKIDIKVSLNSELGSSRGGGRQKNDQEAVRILAEIDELQRKIMALEGSEVYQFLEKDKVLLVKDPVKKTNVILKNVNFQYAMKLWDYLRDNFDDKTTSVDEKKDYKDTGRLRNLMDEGFLLQYLTMKTLDEEEEENKETKDELQDVILEQMIDRMLDLNVDMTQRELKQLIAARYEILKYKRLEVIRQIQKIFKAHMDKYVQKIERKK